MKDAVVITPRIRIPRSELRITSVRSSGPGGQNVNKVNSKVVLKWSVKTTQSLPEAVRQRFLAAYRRRISDRGDLVLTSQRFRDRHKNVIDCLEKLRGLVAAVARPPKKRKATRPSAASKQRRLKEKRERSERKQRRRPRPDDD